MLRQTRKRIVYAHRTWIQIENVKFVGEWNLLHLDRLGFPILWMARIWVYSWWLVSSFHFNLKTRVIMWHFHSSGIEAVVRQRLNNSVRDAARGVAYPFSPILSCSPHCLIRFNSCQTSDSEKHRHLTGHLGKKACSGKRWQIGCKHCRNLKKISKRNQPNVGMGGWMEAMADKVHKQEEHITQYCYISHNHPYISSSDVSQCLHPSTHPYIVDFF